MTGVIATIPRIQFSNALGLPLAGGKLTTYRAGTTTPEPTYQDQELTIANPTTITLDSTGSCVLWLDPAKSYKFLLKNALGVTQPGWPVDNISGAAPGHVLVDLASSTGTEIVNGTWFGGVVAKVSALGSSLGTSLMGFIQAGIGAITRPLQDKLREIEVSVTDFGADPTGVADSTAAFQKAVDHFQSKSAGYSSPFVTITVPPGTYKISGTISINFSNNVMQVCFESKGARLIGAGANIGLNFNNGGYRNILRKLEFVKFSSAVRYTTNNRNECQLVIDNCTSGENDIFLDTGSYAESRSTMIRVMNALCVNTRVFVKHFTDQLTVENSWVYAKEGSVDALFYLSGDGNVHIKDTFLIPNAAQVSPIANARWIDFVSDPAQGTAGDRTLKTLKLSGVRSSLESGRPLIWTFDTCPVNPNGNNQISSITIEDCACPGTGGYPLVWYRQGYPGSVSLRNAKVFASEQICGVHSGNTNPPVPSVPGAITGHVIMIDEATRLSQSNGNNNPSLVDPKLEPFCIDTTSQTSKYKRSILKNIDYRLRTVAAPGAGANLVKTSIPVFFDSAPAVANRDILTFLLVTVSDAGAALLSSPSYRATAVTLVSIIGGDDGGPKKRIATTVLQDAKGGLSGFTDASAAPTVFWGQGDTGSADISPSSNTGTEDFITAVWTSSSPDLSWAYIVPLAGMRDNQQDKTQYGTW